MCYKLLLLLITCLLLIRNGNAERTKDKMYERINGAAACFRRMNSTHQTGCTSNRPGSTGTVHVIQDSDDMDFVLKQGVAIPYIPILPVTDLTPELISKFKRNPDRIAGVIVHKNISRPNSYSHEARCPNQGYGLSDSCAADNPWNPQGTGILQEDIPFPIFLLEDSTELEKIVDCFKKFNDYDHKNQNLRSLCSLELASFMFATMNSQTCRRRSESVTNFTPTRFCDALGDRNVWMTLFPWVNKTEVVLVTARMDTTTLFNEVTPGAVSPLTGLVTLMTTAHILRKMTADETNFKKNIFFILFNGESYDYIGSQRLVYDIINKKFPMEEDSNIKNQLPHLSLSDIKLIVELGQLNSHKKLYTHHIKYQNENEQPQLKEFIDKLQNHGSNYDIKIGEPTNTKNKLPPSSLQSFLVEKDTIPGLVLTDHNQAFTNQYYNSLYDDSDNIGYKYQNRSGQYENDSIQRYISNVTAILAKSLYEESTGKVYAEEIDVADIVDEILKCYITNNCSIYQAISLQEHIDKSLLGLYVGVENHGNLITSLTGYTLAWLTADKLNISYENCTSDPHNPVYQYLWLSQNLSDINSTTCFKTTMNFSLAISPAFVIDDYDWLSGKYSTWTESVWKDLYVRMFLKPSHRHEIMTISVGTVVLVLSFALVYFVKTRSDILFAKPSASAPGTSC